MTNANTIRSSIALATLLLAGAAGCSDDTSTTNQPIKCQGINECKGTSECASPMGANDCQGMNTCKGMGWVSVGSEEECTSKGGTVL
jgi:hypothetical protein